MVVQPPAEGVSICSGTSVADPTYARYASVVPRKKSKPKRPISEKTRAEDERLRRELENADPEKIRSAGQSAFPFIKD